MTERVNLLILGAMKCGTTTLARILDAHSDICVSVPKEPNFFSHVIEFESQVTKYHQHFHNVSARYWCDASPSYTCFPKYGPVWRRIHAYNANARMLYLVRHPIDRIVSNYVHAYERGFTKLPLSTAVRDDPFYLHRTRYFTQINPYIELFGRQRVHLIFFDDLVGQREAVMNDVYDFLEVDSHPLEDATRIVHANKTQEVKRRHKSLDSIINSPLAQAVARRTPSWLWRPVWTAARRLTNRKMEPPQADAETRQWICCQLRDDIARFELLANRDLGGWLK